jgi:hypothetical protein
VIAGPKIRDRSWPALARTPANSAPSAPPMSRKTDFTSANADFAPETRLANGFAPPPPLLRLAKMSARPVRSVFPALVKLRERIAAKLLALVAAWAKAGARPLPASAKPWRIVSLATRKAEADVRALAVMSAVICLLTALKAGAAVRAASVRLRDSSLPISAPALPPILKDCASAFWISLAAEAALALAFAPSISRTIGLLTACRSASVTCLAAVRLLLYSLAPVETSLTPTSVIAMAHRPSFPCTAKRQPLPSAAYSHCRLVRFFCWPARP